MILFFVLNPNILSSLWFRHEYPVQFKIITSSDWTEIQLKSGGKLQDVKVLSKSNQATEASYAYEHFTLRQPLYRADGINTVEMIASATITDITPNTTLIVEGKRGCIGKTTIEVSKVYSKPTLVKSMAWGYDCSGDNLHTFEVPIELFTK